MTGWTSSARAGPRTASSPVCAARVRRDAYLAIRAGRRQADRRPPAHRPQGPGVQRGLLARRARLLFAAITLSGTQGNLDVASSTPRARAEDAVRRPGALAHQDWPSWSPDGRRFAFSSTHEGNQEIYTAAADGTDLVRLTQSPGSTPTHAGRPMAVDRLRHRPLGRPGARRRPARRHRPDALTQSPGLDDYPAFSPDGKRLAFVSNRDGHFEVYLAPPTAPDPSTSRAPAPRHLAHLDARRPRRHVRLEPRRRLRPLHASPWCHQRANPSRRCTAHRVLSTTSRAVSI